MKKQVKVNLGCGNKIREGWVNVDFIKKKGIVQHDLNKAPYPFKSNSVDYIYCEQVLEHLDDTVKTMREIHRILKPGGVVELSVPYYMSHTAWSNPEHKRAFNYTTFKYFIKGTPEHDNHNIGISFETGKIKLAFGRGAYVINYLAEPVVNAFPNLFEKTFLKSILHPDGIQVFLTKGEEKVEKK